MRGFWIGLATSGLLLAAAQVSRADDLALFNAAMEDVAAHNRSAIGHLRDAEADLAVAELDQMKNAWSAFAERFGRDRPEKFRDNPLYVTMLVDVPTRIVTAMIMINFGRPDIATNSLQGIRQEVSTVRRASGAEVLADCLLDADAAIEALAFYRDHSPDWDKAETAADITAKADAFGAAVKRCDAMADAARRANPDFRHLVDSIAGSLAYVPKAVGERDGDLLDRVIGELRSLDSLLMSRYG
jgi:hypothetical protein